MPCDGCLPANNTPPIYPRPLYGLRSQFGMPTMVRYWNGTGWVTV